MPASQNLCYSGLIAHYAERVMTSVLGSRWLRRQFGEVGASLGDRPLQCRFVAIPRVDPHQRTFVTSQWLIAVAGRVGSEATALLFTADHLGIATEVAFRCTCGGRQDHKFCRHVQALGTHLVTHGDDVPFVGSITRPGASNHDLIGLPQRTGSLDVATLDMTLAAFGEHPFPRAPATVPSAEARIGLLLYVEDDLARTAVVLIGESAKKRGRYPARQPYERIPEQLQREWLEALSTDEQAWLAKLLHLERDEEYDARFEDDTSEWLFLSCLEHGRVIDPNGRQVPLAPAPDWLSWQQISPTQQKPCVKVPSGAVWVLPRRGIALSGDSSRLLDFGVPLELIEAIGQWPPLSVAEHAVFAARWQKSALLARATAPPKVDALPIRDVPLVWRATVQASEKDQYRRVVSVTVTAHTPDGREVDADVLNMREELHMGEGEWLRYCVSADARDVATARLARLGVERVDKSRWERWHFGAESDIPQVIAYVAAVLAPELATYRADGSPLQILNCGGAQPTVFQVEFGEVDPKTGRIPVKVADPVAGIDCDAASLARALRVYDMGAYWAMGLDMRMLEVKKGKAWLCLKRSDASEWDQQARPLFERVEVTKRGLFTTHRDLVALAAIGANYQGDAWERAKQELQTLCRAKSLPGPTQVPGVEGITFLPFQGQGLNWLAELRRQGLSGLLADDRGLGKTLESLGAALISRNRRLQQGEQHTGPLALIVVERKDIDHWHARHATRYCGGLDIHLEHGASRAKSAQELSTKDLVITTYNIFIRNLELFLPLKPDYVFFDEARAMKNPASKRWAAANQFKASTIVPITGTPIDCNLGDVWALIELVCPGLLGSQQDFKARWGALVGRSDPEALSELKAIRDVIAPFVMRRRKEDVKGQIPTDKRTSVDYITMDAGEAKAYEVMRQRLEAEKDVILKAGPRHQAGIKLKPLMERLRRVCANPGRPGQMTAKGAHLLNMVEELLESDHRILVFSQWNDYCDTIREMFNHAGIPNAIFAGSNAKRRDRELRLFRDGHVRVLVLGEVGTSALDLPEADAVIVNDTWINLGHEDQKGDRAHRIVSTKDVFVFQLVVANSIESVGHEILDRSRSSAEALFSDTGQGVEALAITDEDYERMFAVSPFQ